MIDTLDFLSLYFVLIDSSNLFQPIFWYLQMKSHKESIGSIEEEHLGSLNLLLNYNLDQGLLTVRLIQARDLVARDFSGTSDPYCKLCLLPNRKFQLQSKVHKNTQQPEFEEEFMFDLEPHKKDKHTLEILLYDFDQFSRDECMGQVLLPLEDLDLTQQLVLWRSFTPYQKKNEVSCHACIIIEEIFDTAHLFCTQHMEK